MKVLVTALDLSDVVDDAFAFGDKGGAVGAILDVDCGVPIVGAELRPWNLFAVASTVFDPPALQRLRFVAPSYNRLCADTKSWLELGGWKHTR